MQVYWVSKIRQHALKQVRSHTQIMH